MNFLIIAYLNLYKLNFPDSAIFYSNKALDFVKNNNIKFTGRSMKSIQAGSFNNIHISPWSGEEIYCKVRK